MSLSLCSFYNISFYYYTASLIDSIAFIILVFLRFSISYFNVATNFIFLILSLSNNVISSIIFVILSSSIPIDNIEYYFFFAFYIFFSINNI